MKATINKQEIIEKYGRTPNDTGLSLIHICGETICVPVSAATKDGIDTLLEMIILTAEMKELKANPNKPARGAIIAVSYTHLDVYKRQ